VTAATIDLAAAAIGAMYADWETNGGVSPDTRDESRAVAAAIGYRGLLPGDEALGAIWELANEGVSVRVLGAAHVAALLAVTA
jgi:hypothetical protein